MKKMMIIAMMALCLGSLAQTPYMTSGRLFNFPITDRGHNFTVKEISDIADTIINHETVDTKKWYLLSSGLKVQILHPTEWINLIWRCYQVIDLSVTKENLVEAINASEIKIWNTKMLPTRNYYWSAYGAIAFIPNYNGTAHQTPVISYKGCPVIKTSCGNPQLM
jgi:hypothetical protein